MQIDKGRILHETLRFLTKLERGEAIVLKPHKKDRAVYLVPAGTSIRIIERGFAVNDYVVNASKLKKVLKALVRREFPRSNKVWLHRIRCEDIKVLPKGEKQ